MIEDLKSSNPGQWYSKLKRMLSHDQHKGETINVEELSGMTDQQQADKIADQYVRIANQYDPLENSDLSLPPIPDGSLPQFDPEEVYKSLLMIKTTTTTVKNDIPAKIIKQFASELTYPLTDIINTSIVIGEFEDLWNLETVTLYRRCFPLSCVSSSGKSQFFSTSTRSQNSCYLSC